MDMVLKRETKIAGLLLLAAWLVFAACNFGKALLDPETFTKDNVLLKYPMIEAYGLLQKAMGKRELNSFDLVKDRLGYLHTGNFYVSFGEDQRTKRHHVGRKIQLRRSVRRYNFFRGRLENHASNRTNCAEARRNFLQLFSDHGRIHWICAGGAQRWIISLSSSAPADTER